METMSLGLIAFCVLLFSAWTIFNKKNFWGLCAGSAAIILTVLCGCSWRKMLEDSGKDTALLGYYSYPAASVILLILLLGATVMIAISATAMARKRKL